MFEIETGYAPPERNGQGGRGRPFIYPFPSMDVGQSFWVAKSDASRAQAAAAKYKLRHDGWGYATKAAKGGLRSLAHRLIPRLGLGFAKSPA
jgi:hypothetical protein